MPTSFDPYALVTMASREFRPEKFYTRKTFSPQDIELMIRYGALEAEFGEMVATLVAYVYTEELQNETVNVQATASIDYPASWWEATKDRWFPAWAKKRWPVKWKTITKT